MKKNVVITLMESEEKRLDLIIESLRKVGLEVHNTFQFGVITGSIDEKEIKNILEIKGVESISEDRSINLPPPDSPVQ